MNLTGEDTIKLEAVLEKEDFSYLTELDVELELHDEEAGHKSTWLQAIPLGKWEHPVYGTIDITKDRVKRFAANVNSNVRETSLDIDYEHKMGPDGGRAAGWVTAAEARKNGLWIKVEFTSRAAKELKEGEWRYFSPEFLNEWKHPRTGKVYKDVLCGGALTNRPFLKDIKPINLADYFDTPEGKFPQEESNYREAMESTRRCGNCAFFRAPNSCLVVGGRIEQDHVSKYFASIPNKNSPLLMPFAEEIENGIYLEGVELRDIPKSERDKHPASDFAGKNRSFPIFVPEDVSAAANSIGRAGPGNFDAETLKRNIIRIAKRKGEAFVAKLPKAWKGGSTKAEEVPLEEFLRKLCEALGLPTDSVKLTEQDGEQKVELAEGTETKVLEQVGALKQFKESATADEEKARQFAEQFPEQARQMEEDRKKLQALEQTNKLTETNAKISDWERGEKGGIPAAVVDPVRDFRVSLSEEQAKQFDTIIDSITKDGLVELGERGSSEQNRNGEGTDADEFERLIAKKLEENKGMKYSEAYEQVTEENPELAKKALTSVPE